MSLISQICLFFTHVMVIRIFIRIIWPLRLFRIYIYYLFGFNILETPWHHKLWFLAHKKMIGVFFVFAWIWYAMKWCKKENIHAHITYNMISAHFIVLITFAECVNVHTVNRAVAQMLLLPVCSSVCPIKSVFNFTWIYGRHTAITAWVLHWSLIQHCFTHTRIHCAFTLNFTAPNPHTNALRWFITLPLMICLHGPVKINLRAAHSYT